MGFGKREKEPSKLGGSLMATIAAKKAASKWKRKTKNNTSHETKVSAKAILLMETHGLTIEDLGKSGFIRESDVFEVVNTHSNTMDEKVSETSPLDGYVVPPVAYFNFAYDIDPDPTTDHEVEFWNLHVKNICKKLDTNFVHNIVNKEGNLQPYECDIRRQVTRNDLTKATIDVFRGKKSKERVDLCISYLKSNLNFNHVALLYPGSKITVAVAECVGINKTNVSICYDHRFLNGYEIMKIVEACYD